MSNEEPIAVVLAFLDAINSRDVDRLCSLMSEDHVFVDALGNKVQGKESMRKAWTGYFQWFPDYRVSHEEIFSDGKLVAAFGSAEGTYASKGSLLPKITGLRLRRGKRSWKMDSSRNGEYTRIIKRREKLWACRILRGSDGTFMKESEIRELLEASVREAGREPSHRQAEAFAV